MQVDRCQQGVVGIAHQHSFGGGGADIKSQDTVILRLYLSAGQGFKFDLIFLDPPYQLLEYANPLKVICKREILKEDGLAVLERPSLLKFESKYFQRYRSQKIGRKRLDFFKHYFFHFFATE